MTRTQIESISTKLYYCSKLDPIDGASQLIASIEQAGGHFLDIAGRAADPDPHSSIDKGGNILITCIGHPCLAEEPIKREYRLGGTATLGFILEDRSLRISQSASFYDMNRSELVAQGQLALARLLWPHLQPMYGWIDERGTEVVFGSKGIAEGRLRSLYWANFFGPAYVERCGRDFLMAVPGGKTEQLDDGGILYLTTERYEDWWRGERPDALRYLRKRFPNMKRHRARIED